MARSYFTHDVWLEDQADKGVPLYKDCYVDDLRELKLGHWDLRDCDAAFIQFTDMNGVTEARVQEIPAGASLKPFKLGVDELIYVLQGRGFASVYSDISKAQRDFEWGERSAFVVPRNAWCELRNMSDKPVRLLHFNYLPLAMTVITDPDFFFNNPHVSGSMIDDSNQEFFSEATDIEKDFGSAWGKIGQTCLARKSRRRWLIYCHVRPWFRDVRSHVSIPAGAIQEGAPSWAWPPYRNTWW